MKRVNVSFTMTEAEALMRVVENIMSIRARVKAVVGPNTTRIRAAYRAANKLQDAIRNRVTAKDARSACDPSASGSSPNPQSAIRNRVTARPPRVRRRSCAS